MADVVGGAVRALASLRRTLDRQELIAGAVLVQRLKDLHDGVTGDYVAWLTFGTAAIGVLFAVLVR